MAPRGDDKRQRIVTAATDLFRRYGFKRTSIDLLAAEAGVAKPTVYAYFPDKEEIFRAVVVAVTDELLANAEAAAEGDAPLDDQIAAMLSAKFTRYWELVHASPHAQELMDSHGRLGAEIVQRADKAFVKLLASALESKELDLKRVGLTPLAAAQLLIRATSGAAYDATSAATHRKHVGEITRMLLGSMRRR